MSSNKFRVSKKKGLNIVYLKDDVYFVKGKNEKQDIDKKIDKMIEDKKKGLKNKKLIKNIEEDKSEGKYELIKNICESLNKEDLNKINENLEKLNNLDFPETNKNGKNINKEEIISYSLSNFAKGINLQYYIASWMEKGYVNKEEIETIKNLILEEITRKRQYLNNAKKGIKKSLKNNKISNRVNRYAKLLDEEIFEKTINKFKLEEMIEKINNRNFSFESIYDIYKKHQKCIYGTKENPNKEIRENNNIQNIDRLLREYLELKKLSSKNLNDKKLNYNEVKDVLKFKIKNKENNYKINKEHYSDCNSSEEKIKKRIQSNMFRKLNYYSFESSNNLLRNRLNIKKEDSLLKNKDKIKSNINIELNNKPDYFKEYNDETSKKNFIEKIKINLMKINKLETKKKNIKDVDRALKNLENIPSNKCIQKNQRTKAQENFNKNIKSINDYITSVKQEYEKIFFDNNNSNIKELSDLIDKGKINLKHKGKINAKHIKEEENPVSVIEEIEVVREFRNLLNHPTKKLSKISQNINECIIEDINESYKENIKKDIENSGLWKFYENNQVDFLESIIPTSDVRYNFTPSFKMIRKNKNFKKEYNELTNEQYNYLKKIYDNLFIVDFNYQEKQYNAAVELLDGKDLKIAFKKSKFISLKTKLIDIQKEYNNRLNTKKKEGKEKFIVECIYTHMFIQYIKNKKISIVLNDDLNNKENIISQIKNKLDEKDNNLNDCDINFFYLIKNLSEKSRNSLEHQIKSYSKNFDEIIDIKIEKVLPIFKYFKNYEKTFYNDEFELEYVYTEEALKYKDFNRRLSQDVDIKGNKQISLHLRKIINSLYMDKIKHFFKDDKNKKFIIQQKDIEKFLNEEKNKLDLNYILLEKDAELKKKELEEFNDFSNIKSKVMLEDLVDINYIINDVFSILVKFATTSGVLLTSLFKEEVDKKEFFKMDNVKIDKLLNSNINNEINGDLLNSLNSLKKDNQCIRGIRNSFSHFERELINNLNILDMINLIRYLCSFDRKQKNNVTRAISNYLLKKGLVVEFEFNNNHYIKNISIKNKNIVNGNVEKFKPYYSEYKLELLEELFKYKMENKKNNV